MRLIFFQPKVGAKPGIPYPNTWRMEPLWAAVLSALTPQQVEREFFDDRFETISFNVPTDLVAISVETYTARRAYQIADRFRARGVPVVLGGFHVTLQPEEAQCHADTIVLGPAESVWAGLLDDFAKGHLKRRYEGQPGRQWSSPQPDRKVYSKYDYGSLRLVETSRGCIHQCEFCSITSFYRRRFAPRPVAEVLEDIRNCGSRLVFFVDDNLVAAPERLRELCEALVPLRVHWLGQIGIRVAEDESLLGLLRRSGCAGVLIGFESLDSCNLSQMHKPVTDPGVFEVALARLRRQGISVFGTFVFGYDKDTAASFHDALAFAVRQQFFFAAFNHLAPFPGTPLYARLRSEERLLQENWWLDADYRFGDVAFRPMQMNAAELAGRCAQARKRFYSWPAIWSRLEFQANLNTPLKALAFFHQNILAGREVERRRGLPLGE